MIEPRIMFLELELSESGIELRIMFFGTLAH
jgi:hypothetical protein